MMYDVCVDSVGVYYHGDSQVSAETAYYEAVSKWGTRNNITMSDGNGVVFRHDVRTALWRERGVAAARAERDCFYLNDGERYMVVNKDGYYRDACEYTQAELQMMYAAWVAGWSSYHMG